MHELSNLPIVLTEWAAQVARSPRSHVPPARLSIVPLILLSPRWLLLCRHMRNPKRIQPSSTALACCSPSFSNDVPFLQVLRQQGCRLHEDNGFLDAAAAVAAGVFLARQPSGQQRAARLQRPTHFAGNHLCVSVIQLSTVGDGRSLRREARVIQNKEFIA